MPDRPRKRTQAGSERIDRGHAFGNVCREFDHLVNPAVRIANGVVGRLDPDFLAALAVADEFVGDEFALGQPPPEIGIFGRAGITGLAEHAVVPALDFGELIAERVAEVLVGCHHLAGRRELDHRLRAGNGIELAGIFRGLHLGCGDVGCELDDLAGLAVSEDRVVARLYPDLPSALGEASVAVAVEFAAAEARPELTILLSRHEFRRAEDAMVLSDDFLQTVAERLAEILVGIEDIAGEIELNDCLRFGQGVDDLPCVTAPGERKHDPL